MQGTKKHGRPSKTTLGNHNWIFLEYYTYHDILISQCINFYFPCNSLNLKNRHNDKLYDKKKRSSYDDETNNKLITDELRVSKWDKSELKLTTDSYFNTKHDIF